MKTFEQHINEQIDKLDEINDYIENLLHIDELVMKIDLINHPNDLFYFYKDDLYICLLYERNVKKGYISCYIFDDMMKNINSGIRKGIDDNIIKIVNDYYGISLNKIERLGDSFIRKTESLFFN